MSIENDHPYECYECGNDYTTSRWASKCCLVSCVDVRDGTRTDFSWEAELQYQKEDAIRRAALYAQCHYECSCGESFRTIEAARSCRKCRFYTDKGYCSEVYDRNTDKFVWSSTVNT